MRDRFFTWPRLIFLVVFAYINCTISMRFAYHRYFLFKPIDFLQLLVSVVFAVVFLFTGQVVGVTLLVERYSLKNEERAVDLIGFLVAIILGLAFNLFNVLIHIDPITFLKNYSS